MRLVRKIINSEFLIYLGIGGLTALVYFVFIALSIEILDFGYRVSVSVAYVLAVSFHFLANRRFTFRVVDNRFIHQWIRYFGVLVINYLITLAVVSFCVDRLGVSTYLSASLAIVVTVGVGYFATKFWVFRNRDILRG